MIADGLQMSAIAPDLDLGDIHFAWLSNPM